MRKTAYGMYGIRPYRSNETVWVSEEMAEKQERKFREAGYTRVVTEGSLALFTEDEMQAFLIIKRRVVQIAKAPVAIKSAGPMTVRDYNRDILGREKWTAGQSFLVVLVMLVIGMAPGIFLGGIAFKESARSEFEWCAMALLCGGVTVAMVTSTPSARRKLMQAGAWFVGVELDSSKIW